MKNLPPKKVGEKGKRLRREGGGRKSGTPEIMMKNFPKRKGRMEGYKVKKGKGEGGRVVLLGI